MPHFVSTKDEIVSIIIVNITIFYFSYNSIILHFDFLVGTKHGRYQF